MLLVVIIVLGVLSVVIAALVIFSSGGEPARKPDPDAQVRAGEQAVILGEESARTKVVVYEDFASPESRAFAIASRDFLEIEAARGTVEVEYRPIAVEENPNTRVAFSAWAAVLRAGTPAQALAFHDVLFDRQPDAGASTAAELDTWARDAGIEDPDVLGALEAGDRQVISAANQAATQAGVTDTPTVLVDGEPLTAASPTAVADKLQRLLLRAD